MSNAPCNRHLATAALTLAIALQACRAPQAPEVIAADGVLCDITQRLAGPDLRVACLLGPGDDPHQLRLTPQQSQALHRAQLVLINGYGLTPALDRSPGAVAVAELAVPESPLLAGPEPLPRPHADHHGEHGPDPSGEHTHRHGERDPHVWHDPRQAQAMVHLVSQRLQSLKPAAASAIRRRAGAIAETLEQLHRWNRSQFASLPASPASARTLASGHRAFASLARAYNLRQLPLVDAGSNSDSLRPQAFEAVVAQLRRERVPMLFAEQLPASKGMQRISALSGVPLAPAPLVADGLARSEKGRGDLVVTLSGNTCLIVNGLGGRCDRQGEQSLRERWERIR